MTSTQINRIAVIGNGGGGKTTLSRALAGNFNLPLTHVDSVQFLSGMKVRPVQETRKILDDTAQTDRWLIDGFGPLDSMEKRFHVADRIIFVDFPLWRHYWWASKRQISSLRKTREELPEGCSEAGLVATWTMYKALWKVHFKIRPKLLAIFAKPEIESKIVRVRTLEEWNCIFRGNV